MSEMIGIPSVWQFEEELHQQGIFIICGVDEAGRGPLAGPVVAAAVILNDGVKIDGINDSKKLSPKKRGLLLPLICANSKWAVGIADEKEIDELNILQATFLAMRRAVDGLGVEPQLVLVDGNGDPNLSIPTLTVIKGDAKAASIAAASIIAKETRDNIMRKLHEEYPMYNFAKHKGYPTKEHYELLKKYGISPCHRKSFFKKHKV